MVAMANENALWRWLGVLSVGWCRGAIKSLCHPDGSVTFLGDRASTGGENKL
jgi:hypothetical protein